MWFPIIQFGGKNIRHNLIDHEVCVIEEILLLPRDILWSWEINDVNMMDFPQEVSLMWDACLRLIRTWALSQTLSYNPHNVFGH